MTVWLYESALLWSGEKYRAAGDVVRFVEPVDGSKTADGYRRGASVMWANRPETARSEERTVNKGQKAMFFHRFVF